MKTLMRANTSSEASTGDRQGVKHAQVPLSRTVSAFPGGSIPLLQRKAFCACDGGCPRCIGGGVIQPKLTVGAPDDEYEQEADRVADQVMRMPDPAIQRSAGCTSCGDLDEDQIQTKPIGDRITPLIQRQEESEEEEEEEEPVQAKASAGRSLPVGSGLYHQIKSLKGGGQPLSAESRAFFESRFGRDFSNVRVHSDAKAAEAANSVHAKAFTTGKDVVFGVGQYAPGISAGQRLLAHELTHVVQQHGYRLKRKNDRSEQGYFLQGFWRPWWKRPVISKTREYVVRRLIDIVFDRLIPKNDPGRLFAKDLIKHYAFGRGKPYIKKGGAWGVFMKNRPEIKLAISKKMKSVVKQLCEKTVYSGNISENVKNVKLTELDSMRLTLHGCTRIEIKDDFRSNGYCPCYIAFKNLEFTWVDKGDLHPGTKTELKGGKVIDDSAFKKIEKFIPTAGPFPIKITWYADSTWRYDTSAEIMSGWPSSKPGFKAFYSKIGSRR